MTEQLNFYSLIPWSDSLKGCEREWLEANGFHNTYVDGYPPIDGMYEWVDINTMIIYLFKAGPNGVFVTDGNCWHPTWWRSTEKTKKMILRAPCDRYCDCEWCSMVCFKRRGYIWDKAQHSFLHSKETGLALRTKKRECDWDPKEPETPIMPGGFGAGEGYPKKGEHWKPKEAADGNI